MQLRSQTQRRAGHASRRQQRSANPLSREESAMFKGSFVAIVTPFRDGRLDEAALRNLLEFHLNNGTQGIVPCGTTGESPTLSHEEYERVIEITVEMVQGRLPVIAGTGFNATDKTIEATRFAKRAGATGALIVTPYYNRPTPEGIYQHFAAVAKAVDIPIVVYNIPGRTGTNILPDTMARLATIDTVVAVKESTGSLQQVQEMLKLCGDKLTVLSGDDWATLPLLAVGGKGVISVTANIAPREVATVINEWEKGNVATARELHYKLWPLHSTLFIETSPTPVKTALGLMGKISPEVRLPLAPMLPPNGTKLEIALKDFGLL
jgi:4-hydroxy-tetrahydrodipicolinate synthase